MTKIDFKNWLDSFLNFEKLPTKDIFWLDTIEWLCGKFNNPQESAPCVHVAGSKGKGSVSRMISSILTASGKKTGLYTSPHIKDFYERVSINGALMDKALYESCALELQKKVDALKNGSLPSNRQITWFELVTVYAFLCFRAAKTDANVFEVGLGGRLDATNIVRPKIAVINTIELEHTEFLGDTLEKIAAEKAGIIKENTPVLCAEPTSPGVRAAFEEAARQKNASLYFAYELCDALEYSYEKSLQGQNAAASNDSGRESARYFMNVEMRSPLFSRPLKARLSLLGKVQAHNAFLAAAAVRLAFPEISEDAIERGLEAATLPARFQTIALASDRGAPNKRGLLVLDGAHTANSIAGTIETFNALFSDDARPKRLLFACAADKDVVHIAPLFKRKDGRSLFEKITITKLNSAKQSDPQKAAAAFKEAGLSFELLEDYEAAILSAVEAAKRDGAVLLATGSFYLAAEILSYDKALN
ncbi:MAG: bifunctional folylpolyglutamate synthase/dihydrofolate synthase [Treponema sp.]|nr:bifunctional folylpolyglutamate synthase/dihydrofolate synthase [Treponema sp.]